MIIRFFYAGIHSNIGVLCEISVVLFVFILDGEMAKNAKKRDEGLWTVQFKSVLFIKAFKTPPVQCNTIKQMYN